MSTQVFKQFPWIGGLNTTQDSSVIPPNQLVKADHLIFGERGSRKKRPGINYDWDSKDYLADLTATAASNPVDTAAETITITAHGLANGDTVIYSVSSGGTVIGGLTDSQWYYVISVTANTFKLSTSRGGTAVNLTSQGVGTHTFSREVDLVCGAEFTYGTSTKSTLLTTLAEDGSMFSYSGGTRTTLTQSVVALSTDTPVDTATEVITITSHGFVEGDIVHYRSSGGTDIGGLTSGSHYYIIAAGLGANTFSVSTSLGGSAVNLTSQGTGSHHFGCSLLDGTSRITLSSMCVINNTLITCSNRSMYPRKWVNGTGQVKNLKGTPPKSPYCRVHLGRLWLLDPDRLDRLHYSTTGNPEEWGGVGDSGAIDIGTQDGDKDGITGFFSFKGDLFVLKRTKLYRVTGAYPETFEVELISNGIGCISFNSIVYIDQDDVFWMSEKGIHSLAATSNFGDFEGKYISKDIQGSFNNSFAKASLNKSFGVYLASINSVVYALTESDTTVNNDLWLYNIALDSWYRWPDVSSTCLFIANDSDQARFYIGTKYEKLAKSFNGTVYDVSLTGSTSAINFDCKTGTIYPDGEPYLRKAFKRFSLIYRKTESHTVTANFTVDNYASQALSFSSSEGTDLLGSTFVLGTSSLGFSGILAPYTFTIDGWGRGATVQLQQSGSNQDIEIQGFMIEWEPGEILQEVLE